MMSNANSLTVWIDDLLSGVLAQEAKRKYVFGYEKKIEEAVSLTMPVRLESWVSPELHPIFQMNLPEGYLLGAIRRAISKIMRDDDLSLLHVTGGNQIGRNRFTSSEENAPTENIDKESLESLLTYPDTKDLFHELINRYAIRSGVSGVQPKVLLDATERGTLSSSGYIVKTWGADYPQLAANEYFCMTAAKAAGLTVPEFHLAENGGLFVMKRFDRTEDGNSLGFEDMCSLQALGTAQKYRGTYERVAKSLKYFVSGENLPIARRQFFSILVLSAMVRNGDAHLKNFGVLYPSTQGKVNIAPVYDVVTTTAYIKSDVPALTLDGTKKWWPRKTIERFAINHLSMSKSNIDETIERLADAVMETRQLIPGYIYDHPEFREVGENMMSIWEEGAGAF
jgi:serine/threonine-protein kinase HipA